MSGIVGMIHLDGSPVDRPLLDRMTAFLACHAPDGQRIWCDGNVGLGHALLCTTNQSVDERQPDSEDEHLWIAADARIDDRDSLIDRLGAPDGARLRDAPDGRLIGRAYRRWGIDCLDYLIGDFSFALWDRQRRQLFCARDHFGVKPFYYARIGDCLVFSNALDCVRQHPQVNQSLNDLAIGDFLLFGHNPEPNTTVYRDIHRLAPAHRLLWSPNQLQISRYWQLSVGAEIRYRRADDYLDRCQELLDRAVADRMRTNRLAIYMSGGIDSPALAATACGLAAGQAEPTELRAYCLVYDRQPDQERYYSGLVAAALGLPIDYTSVDDYRLFERWDTPALRRPEPMDWPLLAINHDSLTAIAKFSRVVLYGEDGDALLAPSNLKNLYRRMPIRQLLADLGGYLWQARKLPPLGLGIRASFERILGEIPAEPSFPSWLNPDFVQRFGLRERWQMHRQPRPLPGATRRPEALRQFGLPHWQRLFESNDPGATGIAVEHRYPLMDLRLVNYMLALPTLPWCIDKMLLRRAMRDRLPTAVLDRPKTPLAIDPYEALLKDPGSHGIDAFPATQSLAKYVIRDAVPTLTGASYDAQVSWLHLRPLMLNHWLQSQSMDR